MVVRCAVEKAFSTSCSPKHPGCLQDGVDTIFITETTHENYLMLESNTMGDYDKYADLLLAFAKDNGMVVDKPGIFAVYDTNQSHTNPKIKMYIPIKICTN